MNWNHVHLIKGENINIVYHYPSYNMVVVNNIGFHVLDLLQQGMTIANIVNENSDNKEDIYSFINSLENLCDNQVETEIVEKVYGNKRKIKRITLHVSNDCNLRCKYCYAGGGNYNQSRGLMTIETAKIFVDFCLNSFDEVENIVFFGGEPMLNVKVMEFICNQFKLYYQKGISSYLPRFSIITNGTLMTDKILQFIKENISLITVSIDGPQPINDLNRVDRNGKGSYAHIARFIQTVRKETQIKIQYEATYTQAHIDEGYRYEDVVLALKKEFDLTGLIVNERSVPSSLILDRLKSIDYNKLKDSDFADLPTELWSILRSIMYHESNQVCPIVKDGFAVGIDGTLYPCQMLNGITKNGMGKIEGDNIFNSSSLSTSWRPKLQFKESEKCKTCWAQNLCGGCAVQRFYHEETQEFSIEPNSDFCGFTQQYLEQILLIIAAIRKNLSLWTALIKKEKTA